MRTKNSIYNMIGALSLYAIKIIFTFVGKTFLIKILGNEYNGINGLFSNIISMLSIAELGIGSAIVYNLYKPARDNDINAIKSIMLFYKKCYHVIAFVVFMIGICVSPFIGGIVGKVNIHENIYVLYYLFLLNSVVSYFLAYRRSILYVYQKNYIISIFDIIFTILIQLFQIASLVLFHNYVTYLIIGIWFQIAENLLIYIYTGRQYTYLREKKAMPIPADVYEDVKTKVKGLLFHNIGQYVVLGTDNILLSRLVSVVAVGFYSNYLTIINPLQSILTQILQATQASVGNLLVENNKVKDFEIYKKLEFLNFSIYSVISISLYYVIQDFIILWLGEDYLFSPLVVFCLMLKFWQTGMRGAMNIFKNAAGIFYEDRYIPIIEAFINIIVSVFLTIKIGIAGIFIGTIISSMCVFLYSYPFIVYRRVFQRKPMEYFISLFKFFIEWILCFYFIRIAVQLFETVMNISHPLWCFLVKGFMSVVLCSLFIFLLNIKNREMGFFLKKGKDLWNISRHKFRGRL